MAKIFYAVGEVGMMTKYGGGTSGYFGSVCPRGAPIKDMGFSSGSVHFMGLFDVLTNIISQGNLRRGHLAPYLPIDHPDIDEFLNIGTEGHPIQDSIYGVTVTDKWLQEMINGDEEKRITWAKIPQRRSEIGYPYIVFIDTINLLTIILLMFIKTRILRFMLAIFFRR